jgi:hypothetical protein
MPLKAIIRGSSYAVTPISWTNRTSGASKLRVKEMGSRYLFIILYVFFEHHLSRGDYRRVDNGLQSGRHHWRVAAPAVRARTDRASQAGIDDVAAADGERLTPPRDIAEQP